MREDSRVWPAIGLLGITLVIDVVDFAEVFWRSAPDPTWDTRWRSLDPTESTWLAYMATSRNWIATLSDPEEIALARGFRRHERRYVVYADLAVVPFVVAAAVLLVAGLVSIGSSASWPSSSPPPAVRSSPSAGDGSRRPTSRQKPPTGG